MAESLPVSISAAEALAGHGVEPLAENPDAHGCRENMTAETNAVRSAEVGPVPCSTPSLLDGLHVGRNDMRAVCFDTASESVDAGTDWFGEIDDHVEDTLVVLRDVRSQRARPGQLDAAGNVCAGAVVWACARQNHSSDGRIRFAKFEPLANDLCTLRTLIIVVPPLTFRTYQILPHTNSYFHCLYSYPDLLQ